MTRRNVSMRYANSLIPLRHRGETDDIGKAALFLVSDLASYITGTTLDVDGGLLAANLFPARAAGAQPRWFTMTVPMGFTARSTHPTVLGNS